MRAAGRAVRARGIQREFQRQQQQRFSGLCGTVAPAARGGEESGYGATGGVYRVAGVAAAAASEGRQRCGQAGSLANGSVGDYGFLSFATRGASSSASTSPSLAVQEYKAGPLAEYDRRIAAGGLKSGDEFQERTLTELQDLFEKLMRDAYEIGLDQSSPRYSQRGRGGGWLFKHFMPNVKVAAPRGIYLYGGVGTGKTMLMDMFYEQLPKSWRKRRIHFHDFMLDVHSRLQRSRGMTDPLEVVAEDIADEAVLQCIDEFMVSDVADALILNRLFGHLFKCGIVMVSTSNRAPDALYEGGLQRDLFLPFIAKLKEHCVVHEIGSPTDYRRLTAAESGFYFMGPGSSETLRKLFLSALNGEEAKPTTAEVIMGRQLKIPLAGAGCAFFQFHELCEMPLGAADFIGLFSYFDSVQYHSNGNIIVNLEESFHTLALDNVPVFGSHNRVSAYRFVTLVDVMYEHKARFMCSAEALPIELFRKVVTRADARSMKRRDVRSSRGEDADLLVDNELGFAKDRTISRLTEMHSREYLGEHAAIHLGGEQYMKVGSNGQAVNR